MVVLSVKFTVLISWSPICISLILLLVLMKLASTSAAILCNSMDSRHPWRTHISVKGSNRRPFILILDSILVYVNKFVSITETMRSKKKDKINSKVITERFWFSLFDSWIISQIVGRVCTVNLFSFNSFWILFTYHSQAFIQAVLLMSVFKQRLSFQIL